MGGGGGGLDVISIFPFFLNNEERNVLDLRLITRNMVMMKNHLRHQNQFYLS